MECKILLKMQPNLIAQYKKKKSLSAFTRLLSTRIHVTNPEEKRRGKKLRNRE
jgi:hypothetical protein